MAHHRWPAIAVATTHRSPLWTLAPSDCPTRRRQTSGDRSCIDSHGCSGSPSVVQGPNSGPRRTSARTPDLRREWDSNPRYPGGTTVFEKDPEGRSSRRYPYLLGVFKLDEPALGVSRAISGPVVVQIAAQLVGTVHNGLGTVFPSHRVERCRAGAGRPESINAPRHVLAARRRPYEARAARSIRAAMAVLSVLGVQEAPMGNSGS